MSDLSTVDYYRNRERTERALADAAVNSSIAAIHRQLADSYRHLTAKSDTDEQQIASSKVVRG